MYDIKYTPTNWHWIITPEQIEKIKANDRDTLNNVYFDNYDKFKRMAKGYCYKIRRLDLLEDCIQQVYVDMANYDYTNALVLASCIKHSFWRACGAGNRDIISLYRLLNNDIDGGELALLLTVDDIVSDFEEIEHDKHVIDMIAAQIQLTEYQKDNLLSYAFGCHLVRGLFANAKKAIYKTCT